MRSVLAVVIALAVFVAAWLLMAGLLFGLGVVAERTGHAGGLMVYVHIFLMWIVSPGLGAICGVMVSKSLFKSVSGNAIYVGFVSVLGTLLVLGLLAALFNPRADFWQTVVVIFQAVAMFLGARLGRGWVEEDGGESPT